MAEKHDAPTTSATTDMGQVPPKDTNLTGTAPKAIIKNVDMSEEMQQDSVDIASAALEKYNIEKDIAAQIKKEFDRKHGPTWHVVVGKNFGSYVTHGMSSGPTSNTRDAFLYASSKNTCANHPPRN
jgi:dynein light chain LC8-type